MEKIFFFFFERREDVMLLLGGTEDTKRVAYRRHGFWILDFGFWAANMLGFQDPPSCDFRILPRSPIP